ncbi:hypothetical protein HYH03_011277 [Edaphochlamys debaryana]|uniref:EF-1-gamma C-terminal domain-containing protein n=1 Tax=Edaphochlamys debaryana TaxID=47281 RepID=A0A835XVE9_9CHLO|nr:hypothetical protein HYH03_011277 [Edaphochlamys debaryana]|eukprot:KAG2490327.1 hypothetical protein HYH03_011277 [Edaphochlamys debaryana]
MGCGASAHAPAPGQASGAGATAPAGEELHLAEGHDPGPASPSGADQGPDKAARGKPAASGGPQDGLAPNGTPEGADAPAPQPAFGEANGSGPPGLGPAAPGVQREQLTLEGGRPDSRQPGPSSLSASLDPAVTPSAPTATVTLLAEAAGFHPRSRYTHETDLSMASTSYDMGSGGDDSDEDELDAIFSMTAWKRYYGYNKNKHHDLLTYFWRRFGAQKDYSLFCVSYRHQDNLLTQYMAENAVHGYLSRLQEAGLGEGLFVQMYVLRELAAPEEAYRVVGLLLAQGASPPAPLSALAAFDDFVYLRADPAQALVRQFCSALLVGRSPLNSLALVCGRELA